MVGLGRDRGREPWYRRSGQENGKGDGMVFPLSSANKDEEGVKATIMHSKVV